MKLKNCKVGQKVVLKKCFTKDNLYDGCSGYSGWGDWAKNVADELLCGGIALIEAIKGDVVELTHNNDTLCLLPKFVKLAEKEMYLDETMATGETQTGHTTANEIKPFMLVEVLDATGTWNKCEVGERLVVKEVEGGGLRALRSDENLKKGEDTNRKTVYLKNSDVKIINSNTGE